MLKKMIRLRLENIKNGKKFLSGNSIKAINVFTKAWEMAEDLKYVNEIQSYLEKSYQALEGIPASVNISEFRYKENVLKQKQEWLESGKAYMDKDQYDLAIVQFDKVLAVRKITSWQKLINKQLSKKSKCF